MKRHFKLFKILFVLILVISFFFLEFLMVPFQKNSLTFSFFKKSLFVGKPEVEAKITGKRDTLSWFTGSGYNLDQYLSGAEGPIVFKIFVDLDSKELSNITLTLSVWDVDASGSTSCAPEIDNVYFNGNFIGILKGANDSWSVNTFKLKPEWIKGGDKTTPGENEISISIDTGKTGCWKVTCDWGEIRATLNKVGVKEVFPPKNTPNVNLKVEPYIIFDQKDLEGVVDSSGIARFIDFYYLDSNDNEVEVDMGFAEYDPKTSKVIFSPLKELPAGRKIYGRVKFGKDRIHPKGTEPPDSEFIWHFYTMPDIVVNTKLVQVVEGGKFIAGKQTTLRTFLDWPKEQRKDIKKIQANVEIFINGQSYKTKRYIFKPLENHKNEDNFTPEEKIKAHDTFDITFQGLGGQTKIEVKVTPIPQPVNRPLIDFKGTTEESAVGSPVPVFEYTYIPANLGSWWRYFAGLREVPKEIQEATRSIAKKSHNYVRAVYPVNQIEAMVLADQFYSVWSISGGAWTHPAVLLTRTGPQLWLADWFKGVRKLIIIVPDGYLQKSTLVKAVGFTLPIYNKRMAIVEASAPDTVAAHEMGHLFGLDHTAGRPQMEGYDYRTRRAITNSVPDAPKGYDFADLMDEDIAAYDYWGQSFLSRKFSAWITSSTYNKLYDEIAKGFSKPFLSYTKNVSKSLYVSGILTSDRKLTLDPSYIVDKPPDETYPKGDFKIELQDANNNVVQNLEFSLQFFNSSEGSIAPFAFQVPFEDSAKKFVFKEKDKVLFSKNISSNKPIVELVYPKGGEVITGAFKIDFNANDPDNDKLFYTLHISKDGGKNWLPVGEIMPSNSLDSRGFPNGGEYQIKIFATDGFNSISTASLNFTIKNGFSPLSTSPFNDEKNVSANSPILINFVDNIDESSIGKNSITLKDNSGNSIEGEISYIKENKIIKFEPLADLKFSSTYSAIVSKDLKDTYGNTMESDYTFKFTTEKDYISPEVIETSPRDLEVDIPVNSSFTIYFSEPINTSKVNPSTIYFKDSSGNNINGTFNFLRNDVVVFSPSSELKAGEKIKGFVSKNIEDTSGNPLKDDFSFSFTTGSFKIKDIYITGNGSDKGVDKNGNGLFDSLEVLVEVDILKEGNYSLNGKLSSTSGSEIAWASLLNKDLKKGKNILTLEFDGKTINAEGISSPYVLKDVHIYNSQDTNIRDWIDEAFTLSGNYTPSSFETSNLAVVSERIPEDNEQNVSKDIIVQVKFSQNINPDTLTENTFYLLDKNSSKVLSKISYDEKNFIVSLKPENNLTDNSTYNVVITQEVKDKEGNPIFKAYSWTFETGTQTGSGKIITGEKKPKDKGKGGITVPLGTSNIVLIIILLLVLLLVSGIFVILIIRKRAAYSSQAQFVQPEPYKYKAPQVKEEPTYLPYQAFLYMPDLNYKIPINTSLFTIGRDQENALVLNDNKASRNHARIVFDGNYFLIEDLSSSNGTYLNGEKITSSYLKEGDEIKIGNTLIYFTLK